PARAARARGAERDVLPRRHAAHGQAADDRRGYGSRRRRSERSVRFPHRQVQRSAHRGVGAQHARAWPVRTHARLERPRLRSEAERAGGQKIASRRVVGLRAMSSRLAIVLSLLTIAAQAQPRPEAVAQRVFDVAAGPAWQAARYFAFTFVLDR